MEYQKAIGFVYVSCYNSAERGLGTNQRTRTYPATSDPKLGAPRGSQTLSNKIIWSQARTSFLFFFMCSISQAGGKVP